jgi:hypothetical protein
MGTLDATQRDNTPTVKVIDDSEAIASSSCSTVSMKEEFPPSALFIYTTTNVKLGERYCNVYHMFF